MFPTLPDFLRPKFWLGRNILEALLRRLPNHSVCEDRPFSESGHSRLGIVLGLLAVGNGVWPAAPSGAWGRAETLNINSPQSLWIHALPQTAGFREFGPTGDGDHTADDSSQEQIEEDLLGGAIGFEGLVVRLCGRFPADVSLAQ